MFCISLLHRTERCGLEFSGDICPSLDISLLAWFSCTRIACGRGDDGKAASSLLVLFQHRFCTDPSAPCKAQSWLCNGARKGSSWPATSGGTLTLSGDWWCFWPQREWKAELGKEGGDSSCYSAAVQCAEGWTDEIYVAASWFLSVYHQVVLNSKRNVV